MLVDKQNKKTSEKKDVNQTDKHKPLNLSASLLMNSFSKDSEQLKDFEKVIKIMGVEGFDSIVKEFNADYYSDKFASQIDSLRNSSIDEVQMQFEHGRDIKELGLHPFASQPDYVTRIFDKFPRTWLQRFRRFRDLLENFKNGRNEFGMKVTARKISNPQGYQSLKSLMNKFVLNYVNLPFSLPVMDDGNAIFGDMDEGRQTDLKEAKTWNLSKYKLYISFIRDQISLLPAANDAFTRVMNSTEFTSLLSEQLQVNVAGDYQGDEKPVDTAQATKLFETYLWRGFNRALVNSVITPSIRTMAVGSEAGMVSLSSFDPVDAGLFYGALMSAMRRNAPATYITKRITEYVRRNAQWISDVQIFTEMCSSSVAQSGPFVFEMLAKAIDDPGLRQYMAISDFDDYRTDYVDYNILGMKVHRDVIVRNLYNEPLLIQDSITQSEIDDRLLKDINSANIAKLIGLYSYLKGNDLFWNLDKTNLMRYLKFSGLVASNSFNAKDVTSFSFWPLIRKLTFIQFLSNTSSLKSATDSLAQFMTGGSTSLQSLSDYATAVLANCHEALLITIERFLTTVACSRDFFDLKVWQHLKDWKVNLPLPVDHHVECGVDTQLARTFDYATSLTFLTEGKTKFRNYLFDKVLEDNPDLLTEESIELKKILSSMNAAGKISTEIVNIRHFDSNYSHEFDYLQLNNANVNLTFREHFISEPKILRSDDPRFRSLQTYSERDITNLNFFSPVEDAIRTDKKIKVIKTISDAVDSESKTVFPGLYYAITAQMDPTILYDFSKVVSTLDEFPLSFITSSKRYGDRSADSLDLIYGINWRDRDDATLLRLVDPVDLIAIEEVSSIDVPAAFNITLPRSIDDYKVKVYDTSYDVTVNNVDNPEDRSNKKDGGTQHTTKESVTADSVPQGDKGDEQKGDVDPKLTENSKAKTFLDSLYE